MKIKRMTKFFELFFSLPIYVWPKGKIQAKDFETQHCFHTEYQPTNTANYIEKLQQTINKPTLLEIREPLGTTLILLYIEETTILIGPFTEYEWNLHLAEKALANVGLSVSSINQYKIYYCGYSVWNCEMITQAIKSFLTVECFDVNTLYHDKLNILPSQKTERKEAFFDKYDYNINYTYMLETEFMDAVKRGNKTQAIDILVKMRNKTHRTNYSKNKSVEHIIGFTLWRTLCRISAKQSGLPPIIVDAISQKYIQKLYNFEFGHRIRQDVSLAEEMVIEFCEEISRFKKEKYPVMVRKAIDYIKLNLGNQLTTSIVADQLNVSATYLSKQFKNSTGITLTKFIQIQRTEKAAEMLCMSNNTIQDISYYVGYEDNNYFVKVFKAHYGVTPSEYRNKYMP